MSLWDQLRRLYSLNTLDTRFTTSSQAPAKLAADAKQGSERDGDNQDASTHSKVVRGRNSKWNTLEYYFYYFVFITAVPLMFYVPYTASQCRFRNKEFKCF